MASSGGRLLFKTLSDALDGVVEYGVPVAGGSMFEALIFFVGDKLSF